MFLIPPRCPFHLSCPGGEECRGKMPLSFSLFCTLLFSFPSTYFPSIVANFSSFIFVLLKAQGWKVQNVFAMAVMVITVLWTITGGKGGHSRIRRRKNLEDAFVLNVHPMVDQTFKCFPAFKCEKSAIIFLVAQFWLLTMKYCHSLSFYYLFFILFSSFLFCCCTSSIFLLIFLLFCADDLTRPCQVSPHTQKEQDEWGVIMVQRPNKCSVRFTGWAKLMELPHTRTHTLINTLIILMTDLNKTKIRLSFNFNC